MVKLGSKTPKHFEEDVAGNALPEKLAHFRQSANVCELRRTCFATVRASSERRPSPLLARTLRPSGTFGTFASLGSPFGRKVRTGLRPVQAYLFLRI